MRKLRLTDGRNDAELILLGDKKNSKASIFLAQLRHSGYTFVPTAKQLRKIAAWCNKTADEMEQQK